MRAGGAALLLLAAGASAGSTLFNIAIPAQLNKDGGYAHVAALFGQPKYDESLSQRLVYANSTLCDVDPSMRGAVSSPYLMFAERGGCTFVVKARNAQALGASGLVIADDRCVCGTACEPQARCEGQEPIMADDGSGSDISIASVMLYKEDGDAIRDYFKCGAYPGQKCKHDPWTVEALVQASLEYTVPAPDARVEWELWTTSIDEASLDFLRDFKDTVLALGTKQLFTPHFYTYNGSHYGCDLKLASDDELCGNLCMIRRESIGFVLHSFDHLQGHRRIMVRDCAAPSSLRSFDEIIRQVTLSEPERGLLLLRVRDEIKMTIAAYQTLFECLEAISIIASPIAPFFINSTVNASSPLNISYF